MQRFLNIRSTCARHIVPFHSTPKVPILRRPSSFFNISHWSNYVIVSLEKRKFHTSLWSSAEKLKTLEGDTRSSKINESSSVDEVVRWAEQFIEKEDALKLKIQKINGNALLQQTTDTLIRYVGIPFGPVSILIKEIDKLQPQAQGILKEDFTLGAPHPLLQTPGFSWIYQESPDLNKSLQGLSTHYDNWKKGITDKGMHPLFLALSGAGTGKSRLLQEFPGLSRKAVLENTELANRLKDSYVFNISFENGTAFSDDDKSASQAIVNRMLWQLYTHKNKLDYTTFVSLIPDNYDTPFNVLKLLAQLLCKELKDITVFILLDGLQKLPHINGKKDTLFYNVIATVAKMINQYPVFVIGCCSATVAVPVSEVLATSPQYRVFLTVPPLNGKVIFHQYLLKPNPILELLIDDMGGHGRALELLESQWQKYILAPEDNDISTLMSGLRQSLLERYPDYRRGEATGFMLPILRAVMTKYEFKSEKDIIPGTECTVDEACSFGLIRFNEHQKTLDCAFIWIWLIVTEKDQNLYQLVTGQYEKIDAISHGYKANFPNWTQFELFNAHYRCLKSTIYAGKTIPMSKLHNGAILNADFNITIKPLQVVEASRQYQTKSSAKEDIIQCRKGTYKVSDGKHFFIGTGNSPSADGWCQLTNEPTMREIHQYKFVHDLKITHKSFNLERQKAADEDDFFMMFSIFENNELTEQTLPPLSGLVTKDNFENYYGPFAGRLFFMTTLNSIFSINTATRDQLEMVPGIGPARADLILQKRPFDNLDDSVKKTGLCHKVLEHFFFVK